MKKTKRQQTTDFKDYSFGSSPKNRQAGKEFVFVRLSTQRAVLVKEK